MYGIKKRDGRLVAYDRDKIKNAIEKAVKSTYGKIIPLDISYENIERGIYERACTSDSVTVEDVQDLVEKELMSVDKDVAKKYILYRNKRTEFREANSSLMQIYNDITFKDSKDSEIKRENANVDGDTAMGTMLKYGSEGSKKFYEMFVLEPEVSKAHKEGDIHIHDMDFYTLTTTCCQIDLLKLFKNGFSTGHGFLREPNSISSYSALACIAIQSNQNDQHGGQAIVNFDYALAEGVKKSFIKHLITVTEIVLYSCKDNIDIKKFCDIIKEHLKELSDKHSLLTDEGKKSVLESYCRKGVSLSDAEKIYELACKYLDRETYQAMEALIHNLNTMHSRAGAQTPFSSLNYGMCTSPEARLVVKNLLLATEAGLGNGETPIFPIQIFRVKEGVNYNPDDPNYDLFQLACRCSAKRLFPNFSFQDAPFNLQYYKEGHPETEIAYMGCRTRVIGNVFEDKQISNGRGNLSFTSINLPRIAIKSNKDLNKFYELLDEEIELVKNQLLHRYKIQCAKTVRNYPFLMGNGVWIDSEKLSIDDTLEEVLKHGTLSVGFIGLAETLVALTGKHHGESDESQKLGLEIISHMRDKMDEYTKQYTLNFTLLATPAEGLSGRFVKLDKERYGVIEGVTDREYYTNSFHIPVYFPITASRKIELEAPYHALTNAGHITYVELDGDPLKNLKAFESIVRHMKECGIGYGSINHPVDRDPVCGYTGIIDDVCPRCGRKEGEAVDVEKLKELKKIFPDMPEFYGNE